MTKPIIVALLALCSALPVYAQSEYDLAAKYRQVTTYEVRPGISMTVNFGTDGEACEMILQTNHHQPESIDMGSVIPKKVEDEVLEELVPTNIRGAESKWLDPDSFVAGNAYELKKDYENVSIEKDGSLSDSSGDGVIIIRWKNRGCDWETEDSVHAENVIGISSGNQVMVITSL